MFEVVDVSRLCDPRLYEARGGDPEGVLLHTTDGRLSQAWLQGGSVLAGKPASSDFLITRSGKILRLVPKGSMAYHAGVCRVGGVLDRGNRTSRELIGIEIENADSAGEVPTPVQHGAVAGLVLAAAARYKWSPLLIYGHYGLAYPMGRRSDPASWNWGYMAWMMAHAHETITLYGASPF
jgi:N-acetyl-anhydromuramyl-L-alanine amidase AmpD